MTAKPSESDLRLVANHGGSDLTRALATVQLAKRQGRIDELAEILDEEVNGASSR